jgi:hypothetical protein
MRNLQDSLLISEYNEEETHLLAGADDVAVNQSCDAFSKSVADFNSSTATEVNKNKASLTVPGMVVAGAGLLGAVALGFVAHMAYDYFPYTMAAGAAGGIISTIVTGAVAYKFGFSLVCLLILKRNRVEIIV